MDMIRTWFQANLDLVFLTYGMAFVVMGVAIWVQPKRESGQDLSKITWLFVLYAILHAPADFIDMRFVLRGRDEALYVAGQLLTYASYAFLFEFGRRLLGLTGRTLPRWVLSAIGASILAASSLSADSWTVANVLVGYFVRLPGGAMASFGFYRYYRARREQLGLSEYGKYFVGAAVAMALWALFCGVVRARADFFPANLLNTASFLEWVGVPVYVFRTACAVAMSWATLGILGIFNEEIIRRLKEYRATLTRQLEDSERRYADIVEHAPGVIYAVDADGNISFINRNGCELLGRRREDLVGVPQPEIYTPAFAEEIRRDFEALKETGSVFRPDATIAVRGGAAHHVEVQTLAWYDNQGVFKGGRAILRDVTARRKAEQALQRAEMTFRGLVEQSIVGIYIIQDGEFLYVNPKLAGMLLCPDSSEIVGRPLLEFILEDDHEIVRENIRRRLSGEIQSIRYAFRMIRKDGSIIDVEVHGSRTDIDGKPALIGTLLDITERRHAEEALRRSEEQLLQAQKMEAVGRLAGGIAHDFNNLLTAILGYGELLLNRLPEEAPARKEVEEIRKAAERAASLTRQLLAFSRRQVLQPEVLSLNDVVAGTDAMLRRLIGEDITLTTVRDPDLWCVRADRVQIEQVIVNLAVNARDAMPDGGVMTIRTANVGPHAPAELRPPGIEAPSPCVLLSVADTGHGMDEEVQARIFEPFFTTKEKGKGTGLGLSTTYGIVRQSGGVIDVISAPGRGTTFRIWLPKVEEAECRPSDEEAETASPGSETVLLAEDEETVRMLVREILEKNGYRVLEASDGVEGMQVAGGYPRDIHLLVTDLVMPRMGGCELAEKLLCRRPDMKVLFMSGYTENPVAQKGFVDPGVNYLQKPFAPDALARKVREALGG